jgi:hypothetical protein
MSDDACQRILFVILVILDPVKHRCNPHTSFSLIQKPPHWTTRDTAIL